MIKVETSRFGELSVPENKIITFKNGIPGFPDAKKYVLLDYKDTNLKWLQSIDEPDLAFIVTEAHNVEPSYEIKLDKSVIDFLEIEKEEDVAVLLILRVESGKVIANFNGPLVLNAGKMLGVQVIIDKIYT